jgi:RNA polymerase sigma factor (sigma-70 family)
MASEQASPAAQPISSITASPPGDQLGDLGDRLLLDRFVRSRDEAAFAAIVRRHGPMVLGVCRRLLRDTHEAEDAFRATFLVLVHKGSVIGLPESLAPWLHGVAYRVAARARHAAHLRAREREATAMPRGDTSVDLVWRDMREVLDQELGRLAQKYRDPLVLVYLEGKTTEETAHLLGCPKGTVLSRLARGRDRLRDRLVRRGVALSVWTMVMVLVEKAAPTALPAMLGEETIKAAVLTAAGPAASGAIPATVAELAKGELRSMLLSKWKVVAAVVLALSLAAAVMVVGARQALADKPAAADKEKDQKGEENILGAWTVESAEEGGQKAPEGAFALAKLIFAADAKITVTQPDGAETEGTYKLDPTKKPKEFSYTNHNGLTASGIYKLEGDTLTVCYDPAGDPPTEFVSKQGTSVRLQVLKREKK